MVDPDPSERAKDMTDEQKAKKLEEKDAYDLAKAADHSMVKKYEPKFLARGGEHIVYEIPGRPNVVVKVEASSMKRIQRYNEVLKQPLDAMQPEMLAPVQDYLEGHRKRYARLTEHFGKEHVLGQKEFLLKVPVTPDILNELYGGQPPKGAEETKESWAMVRVQKRAPEFNDPVRKTVVSGYAETGTPDPDTYARATRALAEGDEHTEVSSMEFRSLVPEKFRELLEIADTDDALKAVLRDFTERAMRYANETGEILDLAGADNVTVFKKDGAWQYRLVDALYPTGTNQSRVSMLDSAKSFAKDAVDGKTLDEGKTNVLMNTVNFLRTINGLAREVGATERIALLPEGSRGKVDFLTLLKPVKK